MDHGPPWTPLIPPQSETTDARSRHLQHTLEANESDHFEIGMQSMVMGTDSAGRLNEEEFITWWKTTKEPRWLMEKDWKRLIS